MCPYCGANSFYNTWGIIANAKCAECGKDYVLNILAQKGFKPAEIEALAPPLQESRSPDADGK